MSDNRPLVLHVVEALGGGVESAVRCYVNSTPDFRHVILGHQRAAYTLNALGDVPFLPMRHGHLRRVLDVRSNVRSLQPTLVHAHSSLAGFYVRISGVPKRMVVYTPHCFAFERRDISLALRGAFWAAEALLKSRTGAYAVVSEREAALTHRLPGRTLIRCIPQALSDTQFAELRLRSTNAPVIVTAMGRLQQQKGAAFFARAARLSADRGLPFRWDWIGAGEGIYFDYLTAAAVSVSGWVDHSEAIARLQSASIYVHTAEWEGFPVTIVEATAAGLPIIARDISALHDVVDLLVSTPEQLVDAIESTLREDASTVAAARRTWARISAECTPARQGAALSGLYSSIVHAAHPTP